MLRIMYTDTHFTCLWSWQSSGGGGGGGVRGAERRGVGRPQEQNLLVREDDQGPDGKLKFWMGNP